MQELRASHAAAIDLTYACLGNNQYQFTLTFYRDGCGITAPTSFNLAYTGCGVNGNLTLTQQSNVNVTPLCSSFQNSTCCGGGTLSCFFEVVYTGVVTLNTSCANWVFSASECCRNSSITNVSNPGSQDLFITTSLNNTAGIQPCNSSVQFNNAPVVFACINQPFTYTQAAFDPDGDSLVYSTAPSRDNATTNIPFIAPYTQNNPFPANPAYSLNPQTGVITFTPTQSGNYLVTVRVDEYRNGVLIATTYRDIQIQVLPANLCGATSLPPTPTIGTIGGATGAPTATGQSFAVCSGNVLTFSTTYTDPNVNETLIISSNIATAIPGASFVLTGTNPVNGNFTWNTAGVAPGLYTFYVIITDNACPIPNTVSINYEIEIALLEATSSTIYICNGDVNNVQLNALGLGGNAAPGTYSWSPTTGLNNPNIADPIATVTQPVTYVVTYQSGVCIQTDSIVLDDPYSISFGPPINQTICAGGSATLDPNLPTGPQTVCYSYNTATTIVGTGITDIPINVTGLFPLAFQPGYIRSINFTINHSRPGDLVLSLVSPIGNVVQLSNRNGFIFPNYNNSTFLGSTTGGTAISTYFTSPIPANGTFLIQNVNNWNNLNSLANVNGTWYLRIENTPSSGAGVVGTFQNVTLCFNNLLQPSFSWSPPTNLSCTNCQFPVATPPTQTTYQVVATNAIGCTDTSQVTVFLASQLPAPTVTCGTPTLTSVTFEWPVVGGAASYQVSVNGGAFTTVGTNTSFTINGMSQGQSATIQVIALPPTGSPCGPSAPGSATCIAGNCPTVPVTITGNAVFCSGTSNTLTATGGLASYLWSTGATTSSISVTTAGSYSVTVTDVNSCSGTTTFAVTTSTSSPLITGTAQVCAGLTSTLDAGAGFTAYAWSNGDVTRTSVVSTAGTYTVTATNADGCTGTSTFNFGINPNPTPAITGGLTICNGVSTTLDAGAFAAYAWSPGGATTQTLNVSTAGTYNVTVTDANGCTGTTNATVILAPNLSPVISASGPLTFCAGGSVTLDGGTFDQYQWSPGGQTTSTVLANTTGTYTLNVTNNNGCTGTTSVNVVVNPNPVATANPDVAFCAGASGTVGVTVTNGTSPYTLDWNNLAQNSNNLVQSPLITTTYIVTVTDANGCTATDNQTLTVNPLPVVDAGNNVNICFGTSTTLTATQTTTNPGPVYTWDNSLPNGATQTVSPTATTTYNVTLTDANTCTATDAVTVTVNPAISSSITGPLGICINSSATLDAIAAGGTSPYTYAWASGQTTASITVSPAVTTTYNVTITDAAGCTTSSSHTVVVSTVLLPQITSSTGQFAYCQGSSLVLNAGNGYATYTWAPGAQVTQTITVTTPGSYSVTVTDAGGCTGTATAVVTENPNPVPVVSNTGPYCFGTTAQLNASGGATYAWTGPNAFASGTQNPSIASLTAAQAGTYTVLVTSAFGCTATGTTTVVVNPLPTPTASNDGPYCPGDLATLTATGGVNYAWAGPNAFTSAVQSPVINNIAATQAGTYTVTVTDGNGCTNTATTNVVVNTPPTPTVVDKGPYCPLDTIRLNASTAVGYNWTGPGGFVSSSQFIVIPNASTFLSGTYNVTVTDINGCTGSTSVQVVVNPSPIPTASNTSPYCLGDDIFLSAGGGATYSWSGPNGYASIAANPIIANSTAAMAGTYNVVVTSAAGCTATTSTNVVINPLPTVSLGNDTIICINAPLTINATPANGSAPYTFVWSTTQTGPSITISQAVPTTYNVTVTDGNGCTGTDDIFVDTLSSLPVTITSSGTNQFCNGTSLTLSATPGYAGYAWSTSQNSNNISVINSGTYSVTVSDNAGCLGTTSITVTELLPITFNVLTDSVSCNGGTDGVATVVNAIGGTGNYTNYSWSNGGTGAVVSNFSAGTYTVTVTDNLGCTGTNSFSIGQPAQFLDATIVSADATCNGIANGVAIVNPFGGTPGYSFVWSNGETDDTVTTLAANVLYTVTVTDTRGCTTIETVTVNQPSPIVGLMLLLDSVSCYGGGDGSASVTASGGLPNYSYNWSNGETAATATSLSAGNATVTITDNLGCTVSQSIFVPQPTQISIAVVSIVAQSCTGTGSGSIEVVALGGVPPYSYQWDIAAFSQTGPIATGLPNGAYTCTVTDGNGCTTAQQITVAPAAPSSVEIAQTGSILCFGNATGVMTAQAVGGVGPYTFVWSTGDSTATIDSLAAGTYTVTMTDGQGCTYTATRTLGQPSAVNTNATLNPLQCFGYTNASIAMQTVGGTAPYAYSINNGTSWTTGSTFGGIAAGTYNLIVRDRYNCQDTVEVDVIAPAAWSVDIVPGDTLIEYGESITLSAVTTSSAIESYTWVPDTALTCTDCSSTVASPTTDQTYYVVALDTFGCLQYDTVLVSVYLPRRLYVPNFFSPNGDGNNDLFMIQGGRGVAEVVTFRVFDRWGEKVYEAINALPSDANAAWDGSFKGQPMNSGVYAWYAEIRYEDGFVEFVKGDITLQR
jgi:gliding motility-associated-like protein